MFRSVLTFLRITRLKYLYSFVALIFLSSMLVACASNKAGLKSPELPPRYWLQEAPGVPVENKSKLEAAVPNLYDPNKSFSFEDCVFLTIQQSPVLVNSAVNLEIKRVGLTDAAWKYLPEPRLLLTVTNNITRYNMGMHNTPGDYGRTKMRVGFYAPFPNPLGTYFEHQAQKILVNLAISTHRKAVGEAIYKIARSYLTINAQRQIIEAKKKLLPIGKNQVAYWQQVEAVSGRQGASLNIANQQQRELELTLEKDKMEELMERTQLKILAGIEPQQRLDVDSASAENILAGFNGAKLKWEDRWNCTEDDYLLRGQVKLGDYNILLAWAQYMPSISLYVDKSPPPGQYQPPAGQEDSFLHLNFDFPLIDWGRRYRGVQTARMQKAQAFHDMGSKRTNYSNKWLQAEQKVALAATDLKLKETRFETAGIQLKEASIAFDEGTQEFPAIYDRQKEAVNAQIDLIKAQLTYKLAQLEWMYLANLLQEPFLGTPAKEFF